MRTDFHPSTFAPPLVWARLLRQNGGVPPRYWGRLAQILALSALATPLRAAESLRYGRRLARVRVEPPLFVLGFPRSGTTHLQNLLACDPRYGFLSAYQMVVPTFSLIGRGWLRRLMDKGMRAQGEQTRPMDRVKITLDAPQEEDVALAGMSHRSFVHALSFPGLNRRLLHRYVLMGGGAAADEPLAAGELRRWDRDYLRVVRKMTLHSGGRPLLLRNTVNMGRVDHLLRLFPDAKFIHLIRNPYTVYSSVMHLYRTLLPLYCLDDYDWPEFEDFLTEAYEAVVAKYLADRSLIPEGRLAETRFEDLDENPLGELERLYAELDLPGWDAARKEIEPYLESLSGFRKNRFDPDPETIRRVEERWGFALREWNYRPPPPPPPRSGGVTTEERCDEVEIRRGIDAAGPQRGLWRPLVRPRFAPEPCARRGGAHGPGARAADRNGPR